LLSGRLIVGRTGTQLFESIRTMTTYCPKETMRGTIGFEPRWLQEYATKFLHGLKFATLTHVQYAGKENPYLEDSIDSNITKLVNLIERKYLSTASEFRPIDFGSKSQYLTLDVISDIAFGEAFGFVENDEDMFSYIKTTESTIPILILTGSFPWLARIFQSPLLKSLLPKDTDAYGLGKVMG